MLKLEYKRYLFSKSTIIIILALTLLSIISWLASLSKQQMFLAQHYSDAIDINRDALAHTIANYNGILFQYNLWFNNAGIGAIKIYFIYAWLGVVLSSRLHAERANRFGNLVIARSNYKTRLHHIFAAQSLYIATIVGIYVLISTIGSLLIGGLPQSATTFIVIGYYSWLAWLGIILLQWLWLSFAFIAVNTFCLLLSMWVKQKQLLQVLPFFVFVIVPVMLWSVAPRVINLFIADNTMLVIGIFFREVKTFDFFLYSALTIIATAIGAFCLYPLHVKKGAKDYL